MQLKSKKLNSNYSLHKVVLNKKHYNLVQKTNCGAFGAIFCFTATLFFCSYILNAPTFADSSITLNVNNNSTVLELSVQDSITLDIEPTSGKAFDSVRLPILAATNNQYGYALFMNVTNGDLTSVSSVEDKNGNVTTPVIPSIENTITWSNFENSTSTSFVNHWGYSVCDKAGSSTCNYANPIPEGTERIFSTVSPSSGIDASSIDGLELGALVDASLPASTYSTTFNFIALANVNRTIVGNIDDIEYMQDFYGLSDSEKQIIIDSMEEEEQYTIVDSRDNNEYYIAKLADGHVWMTQNLRHNIGSISGGTYTPTDTDIPANWTPNASDYTDYCAVEGCDEENTTPISYDGDGFNYCWNGEFESDSIVDCDEELYGSDVLHYRNGNTYNWTAAVAMSDSSYWNGNGGEGDVNQSICPAGWRLPNTTTYSYGNLFDAYGIGEGDYTENVRDAYYSPLYFMNGVDGVLAGEPYYSTGGIYAYSVSINDSTLYGWADSYTPQLELGTNIIFIDNIGDTGGLKSRLMFVRCVLR